MNFRSIRSLGALFLFTLIINGCGSPASKKAAPAKLALGPWHMDLDLDSTAGEVLLPFQFDVTKKKDKWILVIHNQDESITVDSIQMTGDSIHIHLLHAHLHTHIIHLPVHFHHGVHYFHSFKIFQSGEF